MTVNLLSGHRKSPDGGYAAECNMVSLTPFLKEIAGSTLAVRRGYESALAKILAIQHLNSGNGSIISEIEGLDKKCPVKFGIDFVDTKFNIGVATTRLARRMINTDAPPCVFLGSTLSLVSATTSRFTASNGYPQISGSSTSSILDDAEGYRLFSRTTPSTKGHSKALAQYLEQEVGVNQLAVIYIADSYGFRFLADLKEATGELPNYFDLESVSLLPDLSNLPEAIEFVKATGFDHVFVAFYGEYFIDHSLMEEAIAQGIAGENSNTQWIFGDRFLAPNDWIFDSSDPLVDAYKQVSIFTANGGGSYSKPDGRYQEFTKQLKGLVEESILVESTNGVVQERSVTRSKKKRKKTRTIHSEGSNMLKLYLETMVSDPVDKIQAIEFLNDLLEDDTFLDPAFLNHDIPYEYEAVIMAGLSVCNNIETQQIKNTLFEAPSTQSLFLDVEGFQNEVVHTTVRGISGTVMLEHTTGTRLQNSTYYTLQTLLPEAAAHDGSKTKFRRTTIIELELTTDIDSDDTSGGIEEPNYEKTSLPPSMSPIPLPEIIHSPPPTMSPLPQQDPIFTLPPTLSDYQYPPSNTMDENNFVRLIQGLSCVLLIAASVGFIIWTTVNRKQPIVRASKPLFLYFICCGVILFASATLPFAIVGTRSFGESMTFMTNLCSASIWLRTLGYAIIISALFAKTFRFNKIICGANQSRSSRSRVLVDYLIPLGIMLTTNVLILSLMMALDPITYEMIPNQSNSIEPVGIYEACIFTKEQRYRFLVPLVCWNVAVLVFSLHRSWSVRNCDLEASSRFPSESPQIFNALLSILMVSLLGIPIMLVVRDRGDPKIAALVEATVSFLFCILVLLTVFTTKVKHVWVTRKPRHHETTDADGNRQPYQINNTYRESESDSEVPEEINRPMLSTHSRTKDELKIENACLRKRNLELESEILLYPTDDQTYDPRNKNAILKNFFGLSESEYHFKDEHSTTTPSVVAISTEDTQHQQQKGPKQAPTSRFNFKKVFADIFFDSSDVIPSYSEEIRPIIISQETTSWSLARELRSLRSTLKSSTNSSSNLKSSSKSNYYSSTIYRNSTATISNKSSPESKTTTNKSSPESKTTANKSYPESKSSKSTSKKYSPSTKSTPTPESDIRSGFFQSPGRLPEAENPSTSPLDKTKGSYASSMAPLGGSPPTPIKTFDYSQSDASKPSAIPQARNEIRQNLNSGPGFLGITNIKTRNTRSSFDSSTAPLGNLKSRSGLRSSFDSSMVPLGEPSLPGASTSISTGILDSRSNAIFRPKRLSGGLDATIPEGNGDGDDKNPSGVPIHIFIPSDHLEMGNTGKTTDVLGEPTLPETDFSAHQSLASANASLNVSLTMPVPPLVRSFRRPSLGDDGGTPPRDPRNPYRHCV